MTHSGGKPHAVGDRGQRYEISVFDEDKRQRQVIGWTDDQEHADKIAKSVVLRPSWTAGKVLDRDAQNKRDG